LGLSHASIFFSHSLIFDFIKTNELEESQPDFAQWQSIASFALMVDVFLY
jgi:hypothetical protein